LSEYTYSREYLREQLVEFHELMGRRSFWAGDPQKCMDALLWVYVNTPGTTESDSNLVDAAMTGYLHRKAYVDLCPAPTGDDGDTVETPTNWPERHKGFIDHVGGDSGGRI